MKSIPNKVIEDKRCYMQVRQLMNLLVKITILLLLVCIGSYYLYFYITPNVTVVNKSENVISNVNVSLLNSNLNFGTIEFERENTIYYSLSQSDGSYSYSFSIDRKMVSGSCGYIANNEFNKRFVITVSESNQVACNQ